MNQYIDIYSQYETLIRENAPECMNACRSAAFEAFSKLGFPLSNDENYRYTDVAKAFAPDYGLNFNRFKTTVDRSEVFGCDVPNMSTQLFFVINDAFDEEQLPPRPLPHGAFAGSLRSFATRFPNLAAQYYGKAANILNDPIAALNTMLAQDGFVFFLPRNVKLDRPVQLINIFRNRVEMLANRRILIIMEPNSQAQLLVCDHSQEETLCLANQVIEIFAEENASFDYYDLEESNHSTVRFSSLYVEQAAHSNVMINGITLTNGLTRNNYYINLNGANAETSLCGMSVLDASQHIDTYSHIVHAAPSCKSSELFKNVLNDASTGAFNGRITVLPHACNTQACQTNRNLCLTRNARMYSNPQLEIYNNDVKCSHGMSTGQIDEQALFYMQSRGITREEARTMLSVAFTADVTENVRLDVLRERLRFLVDKRFRGELVQCRNCKC